jgi:hypothetical protein
VPAVGSARKDRPRDLTGEAEPCVGDHRARLGWCL